ncbi:hypothetical protein QZH41_014776, partial [Actinostola sp. cb2023]
DFTAGSVDVESAFDTYRKAKKFMKEGGFNLRKWNTSSTALRERIRESEEKDKDGKEHLPEKKDDVAETKILGLKWDVEKDSFRFDLSELMCYVTTLPPTKISKREGKLLEQWHKFVEEIKTLAEIKVPRCYVVLGKKIVNQEIHGYSDASEKAYAAVVYLLTRYESGEVEIQLVASKTRVAPLKKQSIPRLELLGAYLLSKLIAAIRESGITAEDTPEFYWTDSYTVLCWIKNNRPWRQYVQHRVDEIRKLTSKENWRHCPGSQDPADIPSRSCSGRELMNNALWWDGPEFLKKEKTEWPDMPTKYEDNKSEEEVIKFSPVITHSLVNQAQQQDTDHEVININRFSSKRKLLRVTALVIKFIRLLRRKENNTEHKDLRAEDVQLADK